MTLPGILKILIPSPAGSARHLELPSGGTDSITRKALQVRRDFVKISKSKELSMSSKSSSQLLLCLLGLETAPD